MKNNLLDLKSTNGEGANREALAAYKVILDNPDLLGRLFRIFIFKHTRSSLWRDLFADYIERHSYKPKAWHTDKATNLNRTLFGNETVTWPKFLEGLVILSPAFDEITLNVFSTLNDGKITSLHIHKGSLELDQQATSRPIPKGDRLLPFDFHRSPLEPLPLKVVRDAITPIGTSAEFRKLVRHNLKDHVHTTKLSTTVNSLYVSVLKPGMSWKRMRGILFALGATKLMVSIEATKNGRKYKSITQVNK